MFETFREQELAGWNARARRYADSTALATVQAIPHLLGAVGARRGATLLDVCCGPGYAAGTAQAMGMHASGIDFAPSMVSEAERNYERCTFSVGDAQSLGAGDGEFDAVVCNFGVFHLADPPAAFREARRVLKRGGRFAFSQWCAPGDSPFFAAVFGVLAKYADMQLAAPAPPTFELSDRSRCLELMASAGFERAKVDDVDIVLEAPTEDFVQFFREFAVRGSLVLDAQPAAVMMNAESALREAVGPFRTEVGYRIPMPAFVCVGTRAA